MNNRFKFRVWTKAHNHLADVHTIHTGTNKVIVSSRYGNVSVSINENNILMQCTGLKDINGKLIYEGDVVLLPDEEDVFFVVNYDIDRAMFVVESQILHLCCNFDNYYGKELEVIGNIYENPELLKECENE